MPPPLSFRFRRTSAHSQRMHDSISLPPVYEVIALDRAGAFEEAVRLATKGADEGTLVWRRVPSKEVTDLDCALVLRPETHLEAGAQLIYVGAISLAAALAEVIQGMVRLRYGWPNEVRIGLENTAFLELQWPKEWPINEARNVEWLVLGLRLKGELGMIADDTLFPDLRPSAAEILERFGKHFLANINRWAEEGFQTTRKRWLSRADGLDEPMRLAIGVDTVEGVFETIDDQGLLVIRASDGDRRCVSIADFFASER
jgi:BirA family biotin operon repressor/biotin-[acetyl-CoA-carboxylase] ligase